MTKPETYDNKSGRKQVHSTYQSIKQKKNDKGECLCCQEWFISFATFYEWYATQIKKQKGRCEYCLLPEDTMEHYGKHFRKGRRGVDLEVDRIEPKEPYSPENCVLACYPCNNAKSDVFTY